MKRNVLTSLLAIGALATAQGAQAQNACVEPADLSDTVTYAVPMIYEAMQTPCAAEFAASPFMTNQAASFVDQFRERADAAWPGTLRLLKVFMAAQAGSGESGQEQMMDAIAQMPDDALRPLVDVIVGQMVSERLVAEIKPTTCADIAEGMELLAPLPVENVGQLAAFIARQSDLQSPSICGVTPPSAAE